MVEQHGSDLGLSKSAVQWEQITYTSRTILANAFRIDLLVYMDQQVVNKIKKYFTSEA